MDILTPYFIFCYVLMFFYILRNLLRGAAMGRSENIVLQTAWLTRPGVRFIAYCIFCIMAIFWPFIVVWEMSQNHTYVIKEED